ncbi:MAG: alginate export family protein [Sphingobium sp.]
MKKWLAVAVLAVPAVVAHPVHAAPEWGKPVEAGGGVTFDPIVEGRLRYEHIDQPTSKADALTMRLRTGAEIGLNRLSFLAEAEGTLAMVKDYNAFPFAIAGGQRRPQFSTIADPMNVELNRLHLRYKSAVATVTVGRQRINLDDQRWVGSVAWRQNEQTFDAVRGEAKLGPVSVDGTYAISQRTLFGVDAGPRQSYDGDFLFGGVGAKLGPVNVKGFAYLLDYDESFFAANSSQTYGLRATATLPVSRAARLSLAGSYARQSDYGSNPFDYAADYIAAEAVVTVKGVGLTAGYERLGSDNGRALQTPMATLFKFNGWADVFLTTPADGLRDVYGGVSYNFDGVKALPGLNAGATYHRYSSDAGSQRYGDEWNVTLGFRLGATGITARYAAYDAGSFGVDSRKFWLQAEFAY